MKNIVIKNEAFDTDEIEYIELRNSINIYLKKTNGGSRIYMVYDSPAEAKNDFELIMQNYNDAVEKRKKGEKSEHELEMEQRRKELQEMSRLYYGDDSDNENEIKKDIPEKFKKNEQESLF